MSLLRYPGLRLRRNHTYKIYQRPIMLAPMKTQAIIMRLRHFSRHPEVTTFYFLGEKKHNRTVYAGSLMRVSIGPSLLYDRKISRRRRSFEATFHVLIAHVGMRVRDMTALSACYTQRTFF